MVTDAVLQDFTNSMQTAFDGGHRFAQRVGNLNDAQPARVSHFNQPSAALVELLEAFVQVLAAIVGGFFGHRFEMLPDCRHHMFVKHQAIAMIPSKIHQHMIPRNSECPRDEGALRIIRAVILGHTNRDFLQHVFGIVKRTYPGK